METPEGGKQNERHPYELCRTQMRTESDFRVKRNGGVRACVRVGAFRKPLNHR